MSHPQSIELAGLYVFGVFVTAIFTDLTKSLVGRLRPNFLSLCQPIQAHLGQCERDPLFYIPRAVCQGDEAQVLGAQLSFPSGHTSYCFFTAVFAVLYIQSRAQWRPFASRLLAACAQCVCLLLALSVGLSRISDHKHHWTDVLAGAILGSGVAAAVVRTNGQMNNLQCCHVSEMFRQSDCCYTAIPREYHAIDQACCGAAKRKAVEEEGVENEMKRERRNETEETELGQRRPSPQGRRMQNL